MQALTTVTDIPVGDPSVVTFPFFARSRCQWGHLHYLHFWWKLVKASMEASIASIKAFIASMKAFMEEIEASMPRKLP